MEDLVSAPWLRRLLSVALLAGLLLLGFRIVAPFIVPVVWAAILAYVSWPAYEWLTRRLGGRALLAGTLMTLAVSLAVIVPIAWMAVVLRIDLVHAYHHMRDLLASGVQLPPWILKLPWIGDQLRELTARLAEDPAAPGFELRKLTDHSFEQIARLVGDVSRNALKLAFAVLTLFFLYRGGARFARQVTRALELVLGPRVDNYLLAIGQTVQAVVYGLGAAALLQGLLAGIGYWAAGIDTPIFLAALTTLFGIIPFAVPVVWFGASAWLVFTGHAVAGVSLFIWGAVVIFCTDHFVRPVLIARTARIPFLIVLFGVLGGLAAFGLVGLFIGPVILAILLAIWREWLLESGQPPG
ncbi:MAG: AI-2E family transporter [Proteobacteria bacterium]|nr:AI-2E family transporter [Pseudomonadota bacterium]